ncbi:MAG: hypothetical protein M0Q23_01895 [Syntrophales bacterium]|jgi:hypothetical protein|nr:hypothetical protein [Syntrophales bacterium]MCK9527402.1 hypothetical protein [Syntrophales bacterium]MDX9921504.1 hypothetical protein [Syntrophales bacterium]
MSDQQTLLDELTSQDYDAADKPFDFIEEGQQTALLCEPDEPLKSKAQAQLQESGYLVRAAATAQEALKQMRYHTFNVVIINETFDSPDPDANAVLAYLAELNMQVRRKIFVALVGTRFRTLDDMTAFNRSVNITINSENMGDIGTIIKRGVADNRAFYHVFRETMAQIAGRS